MPRVVEVLFIDVAGRTMEVIDPQRAVGSHTCV